MAGFTPSPQFSESHIPPPAIYILAQNPIPAAHAVGSYLFLAAMAEYGPDSIETYPKVSYELEVKISMIEYPDSFVGKMKAHENEESASYLTLPTFLYLFEFRFSQNISKFFYLKHLSYLTLKPSYWENLGVGAARLRGEFAKENQMFCRLSMEMIHPYSHLVRLGYSSNSQEGSGISFIMLGGIEDGLVTLEVDKLSKAYPNWNIRMLFHRAALIFHQKLVFIAKNS